MPNGNGSTDDKVRVKVPTAADQPQTPPPEHSLPAVVPPQTKAPIQFNQQVNLSIQQIPPSAWDRLSPEQIVDISKTIVGQIDATDKRQFDYAMDEVKRSASGKKIAMACGSLVAVAGFGATAYLAMNSHELVALAIALPLATVIAMIVGNRFLG